MICVYYVVLLNVDLDKKKKRLTYKWQFIIYTIRLKKKKIRKKRKKITIMSKKMRSWLFTFNSKTDLLTAPIAQDREYFTTT